MSIDELTDITNVQFESQELSGIEIDNKETEEILSDDEKIALDSYASVPAFRVNVPEISNASAKFVYNFFMPNEREVINNASEVLDVSVSRDDEILFQERNDRKPRYVTLQFTPPKRFGGIITDLRNSNIVSQNLDKVIIEGGVNNQDFVSFEIVDSGKEKSLYSMLDGSIFITNTDDSKDSPQDSYKKLLEAQEDGSLTGEEKKLIASALQGMQSSGYKVAKSDISKEEAENADDLVSRQNFSMQINSLVFDQVVNSATRIPDSLFQDEFELISKNSDKIKSSALKRRSAYSHSENTYTSQVRVINSVPIASAFGPTADPRKLQKMFQEYPKIKHAGYIIKKLEVLQNGSYEDRGTLISDNPDGLYIVDENVRYGGVYVYEIRSVYYVKMIAEERNEDDPALDDLSLVEILIASEGKLVDVSCTENVPPEPPSNVRISFDYKTRKPRINWNFPLNPQRDIKRFQVFKRENVRSPFVLIAEYDFDNSTIRTTVAEVANKNNLIKIPYPKLFHVDNSWKEGQRPIYAVACVDAHAMTSNYSTQMRFIYDNRLNKVKNELVSYPGAPKPYPNLFLNEDSFEDAIKISGYDRVRVYFDPEYYKVTKNVEGDIETEKDLDFLRINKDKDTYKIHMINIDNQKDKVLNIRIADFSTDLSSVITNKK